MSDRSPVWVREWMDQSAVVRDLVNLTETVWFNGRLSPVATALADTGLSAADVGAASERLKRFAPYLSVAFPETAALNGMIESPTRAIPELHRALGERYGVERSGTLLVKLDSELPISGSIKARGGIYEVLVQAERLAIQHEWLKLTDDYSCLHQPVFHDLFSQYRLAVGSTGNLGLSIGIMGAQLGFRVTVHMSADAKWWKKNCLRQRGVEVIEYATDYSQAVVEGRRQAASDPTCHFIDDEHSTSLFLGYAVAAERLQLQLDEMGLVVDSNHPLFVYLPCGVGGAPGGVSFGLKLVFGDDVHCVFAEPTHAPCMLLGLSTGLHDAVSVHDFGIDNNTDADGLAVGRPSGFVGKAMQRLITGCYTIDDEALYALLALAADTEGLDLEPSAVAGLPGIVYMQQHRFDRVLNLSRAQTANATHLAWATGGRMVPSEIMASDYQRGTHELRRSRGGGTAD